MTHRFALCIRLSLALILMGALAGNASAQIGTGWTEFMPTKTVQLRGGGARYTNENGIETFSTKPGDERAEARIADDHRTGTWQFEGYVNVEPGVTGGSVHQVFKFLMIVAYPDNGGELRQHSQQRLNATGVYNQWVRVNTIHDADAGRADVYINGTLRGSVKSASPGPDGWYHKYGIYNSSGTSPVVHWRDVHFFRGGRGDPNAVAPDGGATVDVRADARPADAGAAASDGPSGGAGGSGGGSGGTGGGGASGGTGGGRGMADASAGGTSGGGGAAGYGAGGSDEGTGGAAGAPPPAKPGRSGGCSFAGSASSSWLPAALVVALARLRRRRR